MTTQTLTKAWEQFYTASGGVKRPETEADYDALIATLGELTDTYNCNEAPYSTLFDLLATYAHAWEEEHEAEIEDATPAQMLTFYMEQQGVTQSQLAQEGIAAQGNISKILSGERQISKALAKRLAARFNASVEVFL